MTYPKIVTFEGKHGNLLFLANTKEEVEEICLHVLVDRFDNKWYDYLKREQEDPERFGRTFHGVTYDDIKHVYDNKNATAAFKIMKYFSDEGYEYESFSLENIQEYKKF